MSAPTLTTQASHLLSLPPELRNIIYDLVLTTDDNMLCAPRQIEGRTIPRFSTYDEDDEDDFAATTHFNQMMLVCRQLYLETSDLVPTTPLIIFPKRYHIIECASVTCARYLASLPATALVSFPKIALMERNPYNTRAFWTRVFDLGGVSDLVDFCRAHPSIHVDVYLGAIDTADHSSRPQMDMVHLAVSKHLVVTQLMPTFDAHWSVKRMAKRWPCFGVDAPAFPENLKMRPVGTFASVWRANLLTKMERRTVKSWYKNGF